MKYLIIAMALLLGACSEYRCIDGKVYKNLEGDIWVLSGIWGNTECMTIKENKK